MQYKFVSQKGCRRLLLFFAGWAMDAAPFASLRRPGYDILVLWDYRDLYIDWSIVSAYEEICLVAWSFGVYAASEATAGIERRITLRVAVNGTPVPVDRRLGIPPAIYKGTLAGLTERSLYKFYRRMCGDSATFAAFRETMPMRSLDSLREELSVMGESGLFIREHLGHWDFAVIGMEDAIFPPANQWRAWRGTPTVMLEAPHYIDFQKLIDHYVIDKDNMGEHFGRGFSSYDSQAGVQQGIAQRLAALMTATGANRRLLLPGARTLEVGSGTGMLSRMLDSLCGSKSYLEMWDIAGDAPVEGRLRHFRRCDAEIGIRLVPPETFDCVASASTMQWFNSPQRFVEHCVRVLAPGGYLLLSTFVDGNLQSVAYASGRKLPLLTAAQWREALPAGMEVMAFEIRDDILDFDTPLQAFGHLRATGVNSLGRCAAGNLPLTQVLGRFPRSLDGKCRLNYRSLLMLLRKNG